MQARSRFQGCQLRFVILHKIQPFKLPHAVIHPKEMSDQMQMMAMSH